MDRRRFSECSKSNDLACLSHRSVLSTWYSDLGGPRRLGPSYEDARMRRTSHVKDPNFFLRQGEPHRYLGVGAHWQMEPICQANDRSRAVEILPDCVTFAILNRLIG